MSWWTQGFFYKSLNKKFREVNHLSKETVAVKAQKVEEVTEQLNKSVSAIVVDYRGLTVEEVTDLRKQLRDAGVKMEVIKNKVMVRAAEKAGYADMNDVFSGPTAVAFSEEDPIAPAKILANFAKTADALQLKGGMVEGKVATLEEIQEYATMPSREELLATIANLLQAPVRNVAYAVKAIAEKGDEDAAQAVGVNLKNNFHPKMEEHKMAFDKDTIIASLKEASISDLNDLVKAIEEEFDVSASAPVAVAGAAGGDAAAAKDSYDVELTESGDQKVKAIKAVRDITGLGLKDAKGLVDNVPSIVKEGVSEDEANDIKAKLEEVGGVVTLK